MNYDRFFSRMRGFYWIPVAVAVATAPAAATSTAAQTTHRDAAYWGTVPAASDDSAAVA